MRYSKFLVKLRTIFTVGIIQTVHKTVPFVKYKIQEQTRHFINFQCCKSQTRLNFQSKSLRHKVPTLSTFINYTILNHKMHHKMASMVQIVYQALFYEMSFNAMIVQNFTTHSGSSITYINAFLQGAPIELPPSKNTTIQ